MNKKLREFVCEGIAESVAEEILSQKPLKVIFDRRLFYRDMKNLMAKGLTVEDAWLVTSLKSLANHAAYFVENFGLYEVEGDTEFHKEVAATISTCDSELMEAFYTISLLFEESKEVSAAA